MEAWPLALELKKPAERNLQTCWAGPQGLHPWRSGLTCGWFQGSGRRLQGAVPLAWTRAAVFVQGLRRLGLAGRGQHVRPHRRHPGGGGVLRGPSHWAHLGNRCV